MGRVGIWNVKHFRTEVIMMMIDIWILFPYRDLANAVDAGSTHYVLCIFIYVAVQIKAHVH